MHGGASLLSRSVVLPRLLDTLSPTFQQSSARMDGLISQMTHELDKVGWLEWGWLLGLDGGVSCVRCLQLEKVACRNGPAAVQDCSE